MDDATYMAWVRLLPRNALSTAAGQLSRLAAPRAWHQAAIGAFVRAFAVDTDEAELPVEAYATLSDFFTRRLKPGARPVDASPGAVVSPVDGRVAQVGEVSEGRLVQAKGLSYSLQALLGSEEEARPFAGGAFLTLYLSPRDYHRVHAPVAGQVTASRTIPGALWPVNGPSTRTVESLYTLNERLVTYLSTAAGPAAVVMVGATCVARIRAAYDAGLWTRTGQEGRLKAYAPPVALERGQELGVFELGSTVVLLFPAGRVTWSEALASDVPVRMGQRVGTWA